MATQASLKVTTQASPKWRHKHRQNGDTSIVKNDDTSLAKIDDAYKDSIIKDNIKDSIYTVYIATFCDFIISEDIKIKTRSVFRNC